MMVNYENIIKNTEEWVKNIMKNYDNSHDYNHVLRVKKIALEIANKENLDELSKYKVILGALLHDVADSKYSTIDNEQEILIKNFYKNKLPLNIINEIIYIASNVSLSKEVANIDKIDNSNIILKCVQDADRIDSLGAIGIARYFIYGIIKNKSNMDQIFNNIKNRTNILKKFIKTTEGKKIAKKKYKIIKIIIEDYYKSI